MALVQDKPEDVQPGDPDVLKDIPAPGHHSLQLEAIEATFVKFSGTSGELLDNPPAVDEERTYIVKAKCSGFDIRKRKDGERRVVAIMEVTACNERGRVPIVDEQPALYSVTYDDEGLPEGISDEEREALQEMRAANDEDPEDDQ